MILSPHFKYHFIPAARASKKLMIVLHGKGDSLRPFKSFQEELNIPEMNFLLLNAPKKFLNGFSWYGDPPYLKQGVIRIRERLIELLQELEELGWESHNLFLLGFSQGGLISADLALHWPKKLGGVIGVSGYFQFFPYWKKSLSPKARRTPWLITHGTRDDVLPVVETRKGAQKLISAGLEVKWTELNKKHVFIEEDYPVIRKWVREKSRVGPIHGA